MRMPVVSVLGTPVYRVSYEYLPPPPFVLEDYFDICPLTLCWSCGWWSVVSLSVGLRLVVPLPWYLYYMYMYMYMHNILQLYHDGKH